jgi:hypothetical protein
MTQLSGQQASFRLITDSLTIVLFISRDKLVYDKLIYANLSVMKEIEQWKRIFTPQLPL